MFDLGLLRIPTFNGGLVAAWGVSASIFAILTYLVIYLQNILGYSALQTGLRFLPLSGAIFVVAAIAGRLSSAVPVRWLIAPGFVLVGIGLLLMRGLEPGQSWTHLLPGLIVVRRRCRPHQPTTRIDCGRRGRARTRRDGVRHQLDAAPGRHRNRRGRARQHPDEPDPCRPSSISSAAARSRAAPVTWPARSVPDGCRRRSRPRRRNCARASFRRARPPLPMR